MQHVWSTRRSFSLGPGRVPRHDPSVGSTNASEKSCGSPTSPTSSARGPFSPPVLLAPPFPPRRPRGQGLHEAVRPARAPSDAAAAIAPVPVLVVVLVVMLREGQSAVASRPVVARGRLLRSLRGGALVEPQHRAPLGSRLPRGLRRGTGLGVVRSRGRHGGFPGPSSRRPSSRGGVSRGGPEGRDPPSVIGGERWCTGAVPRRSRGYGHRRTQRDLSDLSRRGADCSFDGDRSGQDRGEQLVGRSSETATCDRRCRRFSFTQTPSIPYDARYFFIKRRKRAFRSQEKDKRDESMLELEDEGRC